MLLLILEGKGVGERERERNIVRMKGGLVTSRTCPKRGSNPQFGYIPDRESDLQPFSVRDNAPTNEPPSQGKTNTSYTC